VRGLRVKYPARLGKGCRAWHTVLQPRSDGHEPQHHGEGKRCRASKQSLFPIAYDLEMAQSPDEGARERDLEGRLEQPFRPSDQHENNG
jgi:hypothetical protein